MRRLPVVIAILSALACAVAASANEQPFVVVIDPGHGGNDPGAVGPDHLLEKHIVLDVAQRVEAILEKEHEDVDVRLTRERDEFLDLRTRYEIAEANAADLFISLHVNASEITSARGVEVYFLTLGEATDAEASRVAAWENAAGREAGAPPEVGADLGRILADLERHGALERSSLLAEALIETLNRRGLVKTRSVKQAPFVVLDSAVVPSVLVELGFLTNRDDVDLLSRPAFLSRLAEGLCEGILAYRQAVERS